MKNRSSILLYFTGVLLYFMINFGVLNRVDAKEIDVETAIAIISSKEKAITSICWDCSSQLSGIEPTSSVSQFALDSDGRFRIVTQAIAKAYGNKGNAFDTVGISVTRTYDGKVFREQKQQQPGNNLPGDKSIIFGVVQEKGREQVINQTMAVDGVRYFPPYFFPTGDEEHAITLSEYLKYKLQLGLSVRVNEVASGLWEITTVDKDIQMSGSTRSFRYYTHIKFDPGKGPSGAVLLVIISPYELYSDAVAHKAGDWDELSYDLQEVSGFWVPRIVSVAHGQHGSGLTKLAEYTFSNVEINRILSDKDFIIDWKKGAHVVDDVAEQVYTVSGDPIDENKAVGDFAEYHGLKRPPSLKRKKTRYVLWATSAIVVGLTLVVSYRRWRMYKAALVIFLAAVFGIDAEISTSQRCFAEPVIQDQIQTSERRFCFDGGWWRLNDRGREARITQCSFYVTMFALKYLDVACDPILVSKNLPPSVRGVSLDKIQRVLQAYGLYAEGRKNVSFKDILKLAPGTCAIVALPVPQVGMHYFVVASGKKGVFWADVPNTLVYLGEMSEDHLADLEKKFDEQKGVVLLVRRRPEDSNMSDQVRISQTHIDLGEFLVTPNGSSESLLRSEITFSNTSSRPIAVALKTSCGCVGRMTWKNKVIDAGAKENLTIETSPSSWGVRKRAEDVVVVFPDSSTRKISIFGKGHAGQGTQSLYLTSSKEVSLEIIDNDVRSYETAFQVGVFASSDIPDKLEAESNVAWIRPVIEAAAIDRGSMESTQQTHRVQCIVRGYEKVLDELCANMNEISGLVTVTAKPSGRQVQCTVRLSRKPLLCIKKSLISLDGKELPVTVAVDESSMHSAISKLTATVTPEGLVCSVRKKDGLFFLEIRPAKERGFHHFVVACQAEFENGDRDQGVIIVSINN